MVVVRAATLRGSGCSGDWLSSSRFGVRVRVSVLTKALLVAAVVATTVALPTTSVVAAPGAIEGTVFRDLDFDGAFDADEVGEYGITVTAVAPNGASASALSDANGDYSIDVTSLTGPFRVEFSIPATSTWLEEGPVGPDTAGSITFAVDGDEDVDFGVVNPVEFCEADPRVAFSCFALFDQISGPNFEDPVLAQTNYFTSGDGSFDNPAAVKLAEAQDVGSIFGLGYQTFNDEDTSNDRLYAASFMKRFAGYGPSGTNAVYVLDDTNTVVDTLLVGAGPADPHDFSLVPSGGMAADEVVDGASYAAVGRQGFGDLDISDDDTELWVVNLADDTLYQVDIADPSGLTYGDVTESWDLTTVPLGAASCAAGQLRPFATGYKDGKVYVGTTCTGPARSDLRAFVHEMNPATATGVAATDLRLVLTVDLDYGREEVAADSGLVADWQVWDDSFQANPTPFTDEYAYPQPWLTDIEFDRGDLILGLRDRYGDQGGERAASPDWPTDTTLYRTDSAGDTIRACGVNTAGVVTWVAENDPSGLCDSTNGAAASGPNGGAEWYAGDTYLYIGGGGAELIGHEEISSGGLAQLPPADSVLITGFDTLDDDDADNGDGAFSAGLMRLDNTDGSRVGSFRALGEGLASPGPFGKGAGLGDVEIRCLPAPLEVGNYVWFDADRDGVADPDEPALENVVVRIYADTDGDGDPDGPVLGTDTTDAAGNYLFTDANVTGGLEPNTDYVIEFDVTTNAVTGPAGETIELTPADTTTDLIDSDPTDIGGGLARLPITTGDHGTFDHSFDAGYSAGPVRIGNLVWLDTDNDGVVDPGETPIAGVEVRLFLDDGDGVFDDDEVLAGPVATTTTDAAGNYWFEVTSGERYFVAITDGQTVLSGVSSSTGAGSTTATNTIDNNDDGDPATANGVPFASVSGLITATTSGGLPTGETDTNTGADAETHVTTESGSAFDDDDSNLTIDFGFFPDATTTTSTTTTTTAPATTTSTTVPDTTTTSPDSGDAAGGGGDDDDGGDASSPGLPSTGPAGGGPDVMGLLAAMLLTAGAALVVAGVGLRGYRPSA